MSPSYAIPLHVNLWIYGYLLADQTNAKDSSRILFFVKRPYGGIFLKKQSLPIVSTITIVPKHWTALEDDRKQCKERNAMGDDYARICQFDVAKNANDEIPVGLSGWVEWFGRALIRVRISGTLEVVLWKDLVSVSPIQICKASKRLVKDCPINEVSRDEESDWEDS